MVRAHVIVGCTLLAVIGPSWGFLPSASNFQKTESGLFGASQTENNRLVKKSISIAAAAAIVFSGYLNVPNAVAYDGDFGSQVTLAKGGARARGFVRPNQGTSSNPVTRTGVRPKISLSDSATSSQAKSAPKAQPETNGKP